MNFIKKFSLLFALLTVSAASASIPAGYYSSCEGKTGQALLEALCAKVGSHTTVSYAGLWTLYKTTDTDENGKIWDMYSTKRWTYSSEQCGNYSKIGDCYNREHSFPKSWFSDASPMVSDAFHIYPTDGKVNGQRSNYPFGECANGTYVASSGSVKALGKLGASTFTGYSGTVFEPDDMYKGDFARSYFYMAAAYNNKISSWDSPMLAGNSYPAFSSWAVNLLLKWTRLDEVSQKELNRQEAVYAAQNNRNPFIDHPELAEYIWGNKVGQPWHAAASSEPQLTQPVDGSQINMGYAAAGIERKMQVLIKGVNITEPAEIFCLPNFIEVTPEYLTAEQVNAGTYVTISFTAPSEGDIEGSLNILCGDLTSEVELTCTVESGLPIYDATSVSDDEFTVRWVYLNDNPTYTLHLKQNGQYVPGYPRSVNAADESCQCTGLDPLTTYTYYLTSGTMTSAVKTATTADRTPYIAVLFDGELNFESTVGEPSAVAELRLDIDNISEAINVRVNSPFQVSADKTNWGTTATLDVEQDRFYMRMLGVDPGVYGTSIVLSAGTYTTDDAEAVGTISEKPEDVNFIETFNITSYNSYSPYKDNVTFQGVMCEWLLNNAGLAAEGTKDNGSTASVGVRFGRNATSALTMNEDKTGGIGTISFDAENWTSNEGEVTLNIETSVDQGKTWNLVETIKFSDGSAFTHYSLPANISGKARVRFRQSAGARFLFDNVALSNYTGVNAVNSLEYHKWDAFCRDGMLIIENLEQPREFRIYNMEGLELFNKTVSAGETSLKLQKGLYIVVSNNFSRRVVVR